MVDETVELAHAKARRWIEDPLYIEWVLTEISSITEVDFSQFDLDQPLPEDLTTNGERGTLEAFMQRGSGKTLRELIGLGLVDTIELIGTPDTVADRMGEIMEEVGGDGFLLTCPSGRLNRRYVAEITDGLVPALQRRGPHPHRLHLRALPRQPPGVLSARSHDHRRRQPQGPFPHVGRRRRGRRLRGRPPRRRRPR